MNGIGAAGAQHLADALKKNTVNHFLSSFLSFLLFSMQTLKELDLQLEKIGDIGALHLGDALRNNTVNDLFYSSLSASSFSFVYRHSLNSSWE